MSDHQIDTFAATWSVAVVEQFRTARDAVSRLQQLYEPIPGAEQVKGSILAAQSAVELAINVHNQVRMSVDGDSAAVVE